MRKLAVFLVLLVLCVTPASAHPGRTDSQGGHYDRSTGEYHWHHGMSAHQHYDMDGDGILDCPYSFKSTTTTTSPNIYTTTVTTAPATLPARAATSSASPSTSTPAKTTEKGGNGSMIGWIVSAALVIALYGSSKSNQRDSDLDHEMLRRQAREIETLKKDLETKSKQLADLDEEAQRKLAELLESSTARETQLLSEKQELQSERDSLSEKLESILTAAEPEEGQSPQQRSLALASKVSSLEDTVSEKNEKIQELCYELDKHIRREAAPPETFFASDGLPILCKSLRKKYGDYTAYLNQKSEIYHLDPSCAPAGAPVVHLFNVPRQYRACSRCALGIPRSIPDWYESE